MATSEITASVVARLPAGPEVRQLRPSAGVEAPAEVSLAEPFKAEEDGEDEAATAAKATTEFDVAETVERLNELIRVVRRELQFSLDERSGETVIKVINSDTQELVRQIPAEEVLTLAEHLAGENASLMMSIKA
jgi:flagellar protein FlaG